MMRSSLAQVMACGSDDDPAVLLRREGRDGALDFGSIVDAAGRDLDAQARRGIFDRSPDGLMDGRLGMKDRHDAGQVRRGLFQYLEPLAGHRASVPAKPVMLPPGRARLATNPSPTGSPTPTNTIGTFPAIGLSTASARLLNTMMTSGENASSSATTVAICVRPASPPAHFGAGVAAFGPSQLFEPPQKGRKVSLAQLGRGAAHEHGDLPQSARPAARAPRAATRRRAAEQRDELAPSHSITSSARASSIGGTSMPSVLAVLQIDDQFELGRLLHRQIGGLRPLENAAAIDADLAERIRKAGAVAYQPTRFRIVAHRVGCRNRMTNRQHGQLHAPAIEESDHRPLPAHRLARARGLHRRYRSRGR